MLGPHRWRKERLLEMYKYFEDRMVVAPASGKEEYHYCYAGGYVNHVLHVVETALEISKTYEKVGGTKDWTDAVSYTHLTLPTKA